MNFIIKKRKTTKKIGIGYEGQMHKNFATKIKEYLFKNKSNFDFYHYDTSGEDRNPVTASLIKAKGGQTGIADYLFIKVREIGGSKIAFYYYIEFKKPKTEKSRAGTQSESQKKFQAIFEGCDNVTYNLVYSIDEAINILKKHKLILD